LQGRYLIKKKKRGFPPQLIYADNSAGGLWEREMLIFVTWEVFLLLAGMLRVHLLLPVHELGEGWCQVPVV